MTQAATRKQGHSPPGWISADGVTPTTTPPTIMDGTTPLTSSFYSVPFYVGSMEKLQAYFACADATANGTVVFQGSIDSAPGQVSNANLVNWFTLSFNVNGTTTSSFTLSGATTIAVADTDVCYSWIRAVVTVSSGTVTPILKFRFKQASTGTWGEGG